MEKYMHIRLQQKFQTEPFIEQINQELKDKYGALNEIIFVTEKFIQDRLAFYNNDPCGLKLMSLVTRPIEAAQLSYLNINYRVGEYHAKISNADQLEQTITNIAVSKWIAQTNGRYIHKRASGNYAPDIVKHHSGYLLRQHNLNESIIWQMPE